MSKYTFVVYCERNKTVEIEAKDENEAFDKLLEQLYDIDMDDAFEMNDRTYEMLEAPSQCRKGNAV